MHHMIPVSSTLLANIVYRLDYQKDGQSALKRKLRWVSMILIGLVALLSVVSRFVQTSTTFSTYWLNPITHSLFESYGGLISLTIAYILYREYQALGKRSTYYLFMAFISMAIFDFAHAYSNHSLSLFIWFHTLSAFCGGAFFLWTAVSIKKDHRDPRWQQHVLLGLGIAVILASVAEIAHLQPVLPDPLMDELSEVKYLMPVTLPAIWDFSDTMIFFNTLSALCFVFAGISFYRYFNATSDIIYFAFSLASFLFAESYSLFAFSNLWNITWWYWHVIKLCIFIGLSIGLAHALSRSFGDLYESRRQMSLTVDELRRAYEHLKSAQEELLESEKLASIGKMAATISHEIRNPLAAIKNAAGIFKRHALLSPDDRELLGIIGKEISRLDGFISDFLDFAKPHPLQMTVNDLNSLIEETTALLAHHDMTDGSLHIVKSLDPLLPGLLIDRNTMKQVLWNILINAVQAMPDGGTLTVATAWKPGAPDSFRGGAVISISDTGRGMSPETIKNAFQPFFSTRTKGTGLGLSIVERAIRQHGGEVSLQSTLGRGTTLVISLPVHEGQSVTAEVRYNVVPLDSR